MPSLLTASARSFTTREAPLLVPLYDQRFGPWQIAGDGSFVCGAATTADISIQQASIQQQHCRFDYQDGRLTVVRLEGRVWVNEVPLHGDALIEPDDVISLGSWTMRVLTSDPLRPAVSSDDGSVRRAVLL
ncbi:MAG: FHA domain-containing protein, partial [Planctomycetaceae bacterium]